VGRQDDGLGWAFIDWLEATGHCDRAELMRHYQLHLEDADLISYKRRVLFVDATKEDEVSTIALQRVHPRLDFSFTSHAISVQAVLATCQQCFEQSPEVYLLTIKGYEWELEEGLSVSAEKNLARAMAYFTAPQTQTDR
jgi:hydrogenase maturation protease